MGRKGIKRKVRVQDTTRALGTIIRANRALVRRYSASIEIHML
jgi:hypothetical protein